MLAVDTAEGEVSGLGVGEVESGDGAGGGHGHAFGEVDAGVFGGVEEVEEGAFFGVVGAGGVAGGGADALVFFFDHVGDGEGFVGAESPGVTGLLMEEFGVGFGEAVAEGLDEDAVVVVVVGAVGGGDVVHFGACGDGEAADVVGETAVVWGAEVGEGAVGGVVFFLHLLPEEVEGGDGILVGVVDVDIVAVAVGGEEAVDGTGGEEVFVDDALEELFGVVEDFAGAVAEFAFLFEHVGVGAVDIPGPEVGHPVDVGDELFEGGGVGADAGECGGGGGVGLPVEWEAVFAGGFEGEEGAFLLGGCVGFAEGVVFCADGAAIGDVLAEERLNDGDGAGGIGDVNAESAVGGFDFDGGMFFTGGGATDEEGYF